MEVWEVGCVVELQATSVLTLVFVFVFVFFWFINTFRRYEVEVKRRYKRLVVWSSSKPHQSLPLSLYLTLSSFLPFHCLSLYVGKFERKYERLVVWSSSKPHQSVICGGSTWEGHRDILLRNLIIPNRLIDQSINIVFNSFRSYSFLAGSKIVNNWSPISLILG